ncbi:MAG: ABC transporter ATP-binding protein, partial [Chthoniobacterales bacterium]|nr:ABC transporter ATP-binding protein [Chthoniobacterales bacterium]
MRTGFPSFQHIPNSNSDTNSKLRYDKDSIWRVAAYLRKYPFLAVGTLLAAVGSTVMVVVFPSATQRIIDLGIRGGQPHLIFPLGAFSLLAFFLQNGLNSLRILLNNHFEQKVIFDIRSELYAHIQRLPLRWFDQRATGDIMTRLVEDVTSMERVLIDGVEQGIVAILQIVVVVALMASYDIRLMLAALAPTPFLLAGALIYTLTARTRYSRQRKAASELNSLLHDNISGIRQIKTYCAEEREHSRFNRASDNLRRATLVVMKAWAIYHPTMVFLASCGALLVVVYGGHLVQATQLDLGVLAAFLVLCPFLYEPIGRLHMLNQLVQAGRAAADRVFDILDAPPEPYSDSRSSGKDTSSEIEVKDSRVTPESYPEQLILPRRLLGKVEFINVFFSYNPEIDASPTLQEISFCAECGETIALVGPTGAGKTTLVNLLVRFYEFTAGQILLDGIPIRQYPLSFLRANIGMVTQESFLFNGTAADNLRFGLPDATEDKLWQALEAANA